MRGWRGRQPRTIFELCRWFAETPNHRHLTYTKKIIRHSFVPFPEQRGKRGKKSYRSRIVFENKNYETLRSTKSINF